METSAIVDTAAEVTIVSDHFYNTLKNKPGKEREVVLKAAGRDMRMTGFITHPAEFQIGEKCYRLPVHIAPISDDIILGIDFLMNTKADINLDKHYLTLEGEQVPMEQRHTGAEPDVSLV